MEQQEERVTYPVGTVVLQYVNDNEHCVAVVVGNHMADRLDQDNREKFERHLLKDEKYHIILVLSYFNDFNDSWSMLPKAKSFQFPTYIAEAKRTATKADLSTEIALMIRHNTEKTSCGLSVGRLHAWMFSFSSKQLEALQLVMLVEHHMNGGNLEDKPIWLFQFSDDAAKILNELLIACPR